MVGTYQRCNDGATAVGDRVGTMVAVVDGDGVAVADRTAVAVGDGVAVSARCTRYKTASPAEGAVNVREALPVTVAAAVACPVSGLNHSTASAPVTAVRSTVTLPPSGK